MVAQTVASAYQWVIGGVIVGVKGKEVKTNTAVVDVDIGETFGLMVHVVPDV